MFAVKRKKRKVINSTVKECISFALVQILVLLSLLLVFYQTQPIDINSCESQTIRVDEVIYRHGRSSQCYIVADNIKYKFPGRGATGEYSSLELSKKIQKGDKLNIISYEKSSLFGKFKQIVDARDETDVYTNFHSYNKGHQSARLMLIVLFVIIEMLFLCVLLSWVYLNRKEIKRMFRKVKRLQKTKHKHQKIKANDKKFT